MIPRFRLLLCFGLISGWVIPKANSSPPTPAEKRALELVRKLGDEEYVERSRAMEMLRQLGLEAKVALQNGLDDPDPEIVWRCRELLPAVLDMDLQKRIAAFRADTEGKNDHNLPLWKQFVLVAGKEPAARKLYLEMMDPIILEFLNDSSENLKDQSNLINRFCQNLQLQMANQPGAFPAGTAINRAQLAAAFLVGATCNAPEQSSYVLVNSIYQPQIRTALLDPSQSEAFKKLLLYWMNGQTNEQVILNLCHTIQNINLQESNDFICKVIREKKIRGVFLAQVASTLARQGKKDNIKILATMLDDKTVLGRVQFNQIKGTTEVRDVALALIIQLQGRSHKDYGFSFLTANPALVWSPHYAGFSEDAKREAAHKKWKDQQEEKVLK